MSGNCGQRVELCLDLNQTLAHQKNVCRELRMLNKSEIFQTDSVKEGPTSSWNRVWYNKILSKYFGQTDREREILAKVILVLLCR